MTVEGFNRFVAGESFLMAGDGVAELWGARRIPGDSVVAARWLSVNITHQYLSKTAAAPEF